MIDSIHGIIEKKEPTNLFIKLNGFVFNNEKLINIWDSQLINNNIFINLFYPFLLILSPLGLTPIEITFAFSDFSKNGPDLYPAPFAQSITIFIFFKLKFLGKFFLKIFIYFSLPLPLRKANVIATARSS